MLFMLWSRRPAGTADREEPMGILTDDMKRVIDEQKLGFVATVNDDATPNPDFDGDGLSNEFEKSIGPSKMRRSLYQVA